MILADYSALCIGGMSEFAEDLKTGDPNKITDLLRHVVLSTILKYKKYYSKKYGDLVIACDRPEYWRKLEFPYYKHSRKAAREESGIDWKMVFQIMKQFREELQEVFPYRVMHVENAEADDVVAVVIKFLRPYVEVGLMTECEPTVIVSSDGDFAQLHKYENVQQYSPSHGKFVTTTAADSKAKLLEKFLKGDSGDGIPNFYMPDDHFVNGTTRQRSVMAGRLEEFRLKGIDACANDTERANYLRNKKLIDFDEIPQWVINKIVDEWKKPVRKMDRMEILSYLQKHRCRQLIDNIEEF
jgi:hypothetical protein